MTVLLEDALRTLLPLVQPSCSMRLPLEKCLDRILAEDIISDMDFPPFDRSPLDGYAFRLKDVQKASPQKPVLLKQIDYVPAGTWPTKKVEAGEATRIMTGAKIPEGADAVIRLEDTIMDGEYVEIKHYSEQMGKNICFQGEEIRSGEVVLVQGTCLKEGELSMLAMLGHVTLLVYEKPKVGILATGSELISAAEALSPGKIRDTNSYMLLAKVLLAGGEPILLGQVEDDIEAIAEKFYTNPGLSVYITTGGASIGDYDLMEKLFARLQIPMLFNRVAIKPGMPVLAGQWKDSLFIALSGNPAAGSVSFEVLVRPLLLKMTGVKKWHRPRVKVKLHGEIKKASDTRRFVWAHCSEKQGMLFAEPLHYQGNGMLRSMLKANVLLDIPEGSTALEDGVELEAILLLS